MCPPKSLTQLCVDTRSQFIAPRASDLILKLGSSKYILALGISPKRLRTPWVETCGNSCTPVLMKLHQMRLCPPFPASRSKSRLELLRGPVFTGKHQRSCTQRLQRKPTQRKYWKSQSPRRFHNIWEIQCPRLRGVQFVVTNDEKNTWRIAATSVLQGNRLFHHIP
ncbi:hypothetical protein PAXRUDRAFT_555855 [Paxillus rubicundulus Ve08.2h10]|uniref:Uncharacterized protein n=1 Tax=Paxillus rubicundulus Ve08.2h10 TaxID=930991 RepID=A0A0D0D772_9AGAM|nr:hypothetical protein PAXRUDRAFT_555855 [Paxillus rubicundulus Ve08.2h10]